jgi:cell division protein FtsB
MKTVSLLVGLVLCLPLAAEAGKKKHAAAPSTVAQNAKAKQKAEQAKLAAEAARAEAELADVRSGNASTYQAPPEERNWVAQEEDKEKPPGFARR